MMTAMLQAGYEYVSTTTMCDDICGLSYNNNNQSQRKMKKRKKKKLVTDVIGRPETNISSYICLPGLINTGRMY